MEATNKLDTAAPRESLAERDDAPASKKTRARGLTKAQRVLLSLLAIGLVGGTSLYVYGLGHESTDDAFVEGHVSNVAVRVGGQVTKVLVQDNQVVKEGDPLVEIDTTELEARLAAATADVAAAQAQLALTEAQSEANLKTAKGALTQATSGLGSSQAQVDQAKADVEAKRSKLKLAEVELKRVQKLSRDGVVSQSELDAKQSSYDTAKASFQEAQARLASAQQGISGAGGNIVQAEGRLASANTAAVQVEAAKARVDQAEAARKLAEVNLSYAHIKAPVKGVVSRRTVEVGQVVAPGTPLMAIVPLDDVWVVANFKEDQITDMRPGQPATVEVDSFGSQKFYGKVDSIAGATGSTFALLPPDNASGNFVKVVQRVPVKIHLDNVNKSGGAILRPGMSADVTVKTGN